METQRAFPFTPNLEFYWLIKRSFDLELSWAVTLILIHAPFSRIQHFLIQNSILIQSTVQRNCFKLDLQAAKLKTFELNMLIFHNVTNENIDSLQSSLYLNKSSLAKKPLLLLRCQTI